MLDKRICDLLYAALLKQERLTAEYAGRCEKTEPREDYFTPESSAAINEYRRWAMTNPFNVRIQQSDNAKTIREKGRTFKHRSH